MNGRVLVTPRSLTGGTDRALLDPLEQAGYEVALGPTGRQPTEAELIALLPGCIGYLAGVEPVGAPVLAAADALRVISRNGAGTDNIDMATAAARGIRVVRAGGANARGVAELTIALILAGLRQIPRTDRLVRCGKWDRPRGRELAGRTLGIVGYGSIGRQVAALATALGMHCLAYDPFVDADVEGSASARLVRSLDDALRNSDVVTLHCPPLPSGEPLLGDRELRLIPRGGVLVNTARWSLVDVPAAVRALDESHLAAYATDTFATEPPELDALVTHERAIVTPHIGGLTDESVRRAGEAAVANLLAALAETEPADREARSV